MKITAIEIDGFGVWRGLSLGDLSEQVNVFYGGNEAGKTTLLEFIRGVCFGFSPRQARYLPPLAGGRPGGGLRFLHADRAWSVSRFADQVEPGPLVADAAGVRQDSQLWRQIVGEVDEPVFSNVFACGLDEIQRLGALTDTQAARHLYDLSLGLERVSLSEVLANLTTSRRRLLDPQRPAQIVELQQHRQRLQSDLEGLRAQGAAVTDLAHARRQLAEHVAQAEAERVQLEQSLERLEAGRALEEQWRVRESLDQKLLAWRGRARIPAGAAEELERLARRVAHARRQRQQLRDRGRALGRQAAELSVNEGLCRQQARLEALAEQQSWLAALAEQVGRAADQLAAVDLELESCQAAAAPGLSRHWPELRAAAQALTAGRRALRALGGTPPAAPSPTGPPAGDRIAQAVARRGAADLNQALDQAGQAAALLRRRVHLDERIGHLERRRADLELQAQDWLDRQQLAPTTLAALGAAFAVGFALAAAGLLLPASVTGGWGWPLVLLGAAATAGSALGKRHLERSASDGLEHCQQQNRQAGEQLAQCLAERDELDQELPRGGGPLVARLKAAEKDLAELESLLPVQAELDAARRGQQDQAAQHERLTAALRQARRRWRAALASSGLPAATTPRRLRELGRRRRQAAAALRRRQQLQESLAAEQRQYQALAGRVQQLAADAGVVPDNTAPTALLQQLLAQWRQQQQCLQQRDQLARQRAELRRAAARWERRLERLVGRRRRLLDRAGVAREDELQALLAEQAELVRWGRQRDEAHAQVESLLARLDADQSLRARLAAGQPLAPWAAAERTRLAAVQQQLHQLQQQRGALDQRWAHLAADRRLALAQIELGQVEARLRAAVERWQTLAVCQLALEAVRGFCERDRQPDALRDASAFLTRLTAGRYQRVWTRLGEQALQIDAGDGRTLTVEALSRGTREQLFLALRLALVSAYARRGVRLPVVLDDVLVNFDEEHVQLAGGVLREFAAAGHQVLVFTCHEHIARLLKGPRTEVRRLPDHRQPQIPAAAEPETSAPAAEPAPPPAASPPRRAPRRRFHAPHATRTVRGAPAAPPPEPAIAIHLEHPAPLPLEVPEAPLRPPAPTASRPVARPVGRRQWDAEEFSGELTDRVVRAAALAPPSPSDQPPAASESERAPWHAPVVVGLDAPDAA